MSKLSKQDLKELEEIFSLGCEYADTKTIVHETTDKALKSLGVNLGIECMLVVDGEYENEVSLEDFVDIFYSYIIENVMNVIKTQ